MQAPLYDVDITKFWSLNFVEYNGDWVTVPKGYSLNRLPDFNSPAWETTTSYSDLQEDFQAATLILSIVDLSSIKANIAKLEKKVFDLERLRKTAVRLAWKEERELVRKTGRGTVDWTEKEIEELEQKGNVSGYEGHHINSVNGNEELAGDPNNIKFVRGHKANLAEHGGNFRNQTTGQLIDRQKMIDEAGQTPNQQTPNQ